MPYIGRTLGQGTRSRFLYTATAGQTTFSGSDTQSTTLAYSDNNGVDCFQNGVLLKGGGADYTATSGTSVVLTTGASVSDVIEILVYDVFAIADHVKKSGDTITGQLNANGGVVFNEGSADVDFRVESNGEANMLFVDGGNDRVGIGTTGGSGETLTVTKTGADATVRINAVASQEAALKLQGNNTATNTFKIASEQDNTGLTIQKWTGSAYATHIASDANGHVTMPLQSAFNVNKSAHQTNIPINADTTITFDTERFDQNGDFASNTFTAPVTGKYQLNLNAAVLQTDSAAGYIILYINTSNKKYLTYIDPTAFSSDVDYLTFNLVILTDMDANDTSTISFLQNNGSAQADVTGGSGDVGTSFSGYLVC